MVFSDKGFHKPGELKADSNLFVSINYNRFNFIYFVAFLNCALIT